jgi:Tetratricopeptide repeat
VVLALRTSSLLHASDVVQITGAAAASGGIAQVQGLGGMGKSLLAEEYALRFGAAYPGGVFWLRAYGNDDAKAAPGATERETLLADQVRGSAEELGIKTHGLSPKEIAGALKGEIERRGKPCLWVVDDVPNGLDPEELRAWFAPHALARTLITTRSREYGSLAKGINLSVLAPDEAFQLLTSRREPKGDAEKEQGRLLAEDLGHYALALDVTASALYSLGAAEPYGAFRAQLACPDKDALVLAETLADVLPNGHEKSIAQTVLRSIRGLTAEGQDFLRLASALAVAPIPGSLVTAVFQEADKLSHEDAEWRTSLAFKQVTSASLAEVAGKKNDARAVHTLVSRAVRFHEKPAPKRTQALRAAAIEALGSEIAKAAPDPGLHKEIESYIAHARQVAAMPGTTSEALLLSWTAEYDSVRGAYNSARTAYLRELEFNRRVLGPEHPTTLRSMNNLAATLLKQGDFAGARKLQGETLAICCRLLGLEHLNTLFVINSLAETLREQGHLVGARRMQQGTLEIRRRVLGPRHPDTVRSMNNLALVLLAQDDMVKARKLLEKVLAIWCRVLGPEHPDTLTAMSNLALTLQAPENLAKVRKLQEEVLDVSRRVLGLEHPITSNSAWCLIFTLAQLKEYKATEAILRGDLLWLLDRDPVTLGARQREIREGVAQAVKILDSR